MLNGLADECCSMLAHLVAYVGALALLAIVGIHLWDELPVAAVESSATAGWRVALRSYPAFAVSEFDLPEKTEAYEILRHPDGGRRDILRWGPQGRGPVAEIEIYRLGGKSSPSGPVAELAARIDPDGLHELETAGIIDSKFGAVTLLRVLGGTVRDPASASSNVSTTPICRSRAGRARATHCRPGAPPSAVF